MHSCINRPPCSPCRFHSYGKAAFCLEELMMTNPHNHLYCEQYAEVGARLDVRHQARGGGRGLAPCEWRLSVKRRDTPART